MASYYDIALQGQKTTIKNLLKAKKKDIKAARNFGLTQFRIPNPFSGTGTVTDISSAREACEEVLGPTVEFRYEFSDILLLWESSTPP